MSGPGDWPAWLVLLVSPKPANARLPHRGKIGDQEAAYVRDNLQVVNERPQATGHPPIDPTNSPDAQRYGFPAQS
jgi:hypothetical protein